MIQVGISSVFIGLFTFNPSVKTWTAQNPGVFILALIVMFVTLIAMSCCESVRRTSPMNIIFLFLFTLAESFLLGVTTSRFRADSVFYAAVLTVVICLALTIFAFQTKIDFTVMGGVLMVCCLVLFLFALALMFFKIPILQLIYAALGAVLFSIYLIYDTQLMIGGNHKYSISPEEYIFAALNLYLDIVNIFIAILQLIGAANED